MGQNFGKWPTLRGLRHIPAGHFSAHGEAKITRAAAHPTQSTDDDDLWTGIPAKICSDMVL